MTGSLPEQAHICERSAIANYPNFTNVLVTHYGHACPEMLMQAHFIARVLISKYILAAVFPVLGRGGIGRVV